MGNEGMSPGFDLGVFKSLSLDSWIRFLVLAVLGGLAVGTMIFFIPAWLILQWPMEFVFANLVFGLVLGFIGVYIVGYFWKKTDPVLKEKLDPFYGVVILGVAVLYLVVTTAFYL